VGRERFEPPPQWREEAKELLKVGFEYITEKNTIMLFRKPKRFSN
jgi:hypothetical protein